MVFELPAHRLLREMDDLQLAQVPAYSDPTEHVGEVLRHLASLIQLRVLILKSAGGARSQLDSAFDGLLLRDGALEDLLERATGGPAVDPKSKDILRKRTDLGALERRIHLREAGTLWQQRHTGQGARLPLLEVAQNFGLDHFQYRVLVLALAPEVETAFQKMFSHLLNDVTQKRPTVELALQLFGGNAPERRAARRAFMSNVPLIDFNLIEMDSPRGSEPSLLGRSFKMPERIVMWLLGEVGLSPQLSSFSALVKGPADFSGLIYPKRVAERNSALASHLKKICGGAQTPLVVLLGPPGVGKKSVVVRVSSIVGRAVLIVTLPATAIPLGDRDRMYRNLVREARLHNCALCFSDYSDELVAARISPSLPFLYGILRRAPVAGYLTSPDEAVPLGGAGAGFATRVPLDIPDTVGKIGLWEELLSQTGTELAPELDLKAFALKYSFTGGALRTILVASREEATMRTAGESQVVSAEDLDLACKIQLGQGLAGIASRVKRMAKWEDIILPEDVLSTVQEVIGQARHRGVVFHDWGFDRKMTTGRGLSVLFSGPPGVGKTMIAGVIANELGMDLYKVDLSQVVSKYVGETEKNLKKVFESAQGNQFIILFDEADSLFAKRTEVKSSVDRYANLEVNYLLQKMEEFGGISILTTNFEHGIDDAFKRRINFRIDFPFPEPEYRSKLWRVMIPAEAPLDDDIEFEWLGEKYELAGGNIKNAVLRAAFWAAERERAISMNDLELAAEKEAREIGKLVQGAGY